MKTVVFIETNFSGLDAIVHCKNMGYESILITDSMERFEDWFPSSSLYKIHLASRIISVNNSDDFEELCATINKQVERVDAILTFAEIRTKITARLCSHFGLLGTPSSAIEIAQNKYLFRKVMKESGTDNVNYRIIDHIDDLIKESVSLTYPFFIKPNQGHSSIGAEVIKSPEDLLAVKKVYSNINEGWISQEIVMEDYLDGRLLSVEVLTTAKGQHQIVGVSDRDVIKNKIEIGASFPLKNTTTKSAEKIACNALNAIGYTFGPSHIEIIVTDTGPHLVELNTRVGGSGHSVMLDLATSRSIVGDCVELCLGKLVDEPNQLYRHQQGAAWQCLTSNSTGTIITLPKLKEVKALSGVKEVWIHHGIGEKVTGLESNFSWILQVMCVGSDQEEAKHNALNAIHFASQHTEIA